jgi:hypothetical protein
MLSVGFFIIMLIVVMLSVVALSKWYATIQIRHQLIIEPLPSALELLESIYKGSAACAVVHFTTVIKNTVY